MAEGDTKGNGRGPRKTLRGTQTDDKAKEGTERGEERHTENVDNGTGTGTGGRHPHTQKTGTQQKSQATERGRRTRG